MISGSAGVPPATLERMVREFRVHQRNLPHWEDPGNVYFITFRTAGEHLLPESAKDIVLSSIQYHAGSLYRLYACVVMTTHVHLILQPLEVSQDIYYSLAKIMHSIKSYSSKRIQKPCKNQGSFWQAEYYDRIIRNDDDLIEKMEYIVNNPVKAGIVEKPEDYMWLYCEGFE